MISKYRMILFFAGLLIFTACGVQPIENKGTLDERFAKVAGHEVELYRIEYSNGSSYNSAPNAVVVAVEKGTIGGHISCDSFGAEANWKSDGILEVSNLKTQKGECKNTIPFEFEPKMIYDVLDGELIIMNFSRTQKAYFAPR